MSEHEASVHEPVTHETRHEHRTGDHEVRHGDEEHPREGIQPGHEPASGHAGGSRDTGGRHPGETGTTAGGQEGGATATCHEPPPPPPPPGTDQPGPAPAPSDPMTTTAQALAGLAVSDRPTSYGRGPDVYQQSIDAFRGCGFGWPG